MTAIIITSIICATLLIMLYMTHVYPRTIRKYKLKVAQLKAELDRLKKEYDGHLDDYTEWFLSMQKRLDELANIVFDKTDEK
ncbi:MAG: hypothetical protein K2L96_00050 [Muribaculaceae bacterium]|nr:hypothetical protein [Muribaculaceae bacterium]